MLFGNRMLSEDVINIQNVKIDSKSCKKFWVCVDNLLNWNIHIKYVSSKLSKSIAIM